MLTQEQKENVEKLVAALRGGEYQQGQGALCAGETNGKFTYCCLGVAAKVLRISEQEMKKFRPTFLPLASSGGYLTTEVAEKFGFDRAVQQDLAGRNDRGVPFERIADYLEEFVKANLAL